MWNEPGDSTDAFLGVGVGAECRQSRLATAVVLAKQLAEQTRSLNCSALAALLWLLCSGCSALAAHLTSRRRPREHHFGGK